MTRTISVTGATGFAGHHLVAELLGRGHHVRALVRGVSSGASLPSGVETVLGSLAEQDALVRLFRGADAAVHLAGAIAAPSRAAYFAVNRDGVGSVIAAARSTSLRRLVHVSSLAARQPELSAYAASKRAGEDLMLAEMPGRNAVVIRPPAVYGPGDRGTLPLIRTLLSPVAAIPARPHARFSLIHGRDLARLITDAITGDVQGLHEVDDGRRDGYGWYDLTEIGAQLRGGPVRPVFLPRAAADAVALGAELIGHLTGSPGLINRGKIAELYHPDWVSRAGRLDLADPLPLSQGLAQTVAWYRNAGWLPPDRHTDRRASSRGTRQ